MLGVEYYGHDAVIRLALAGDVTVTARGPGHALPAVGERVGLQVTGEVTVDRA